jgi:hypothetical protein
MSVGIDGDPHALRRQADLQWRINGDIERLPFRDSAFDLVSANMVVEHIEHPKEFSLKSRACLHLAGDSSCTRRTLADTRPC